MRSKRNKNAEISARSLQILDGLKQKEGFSSMRILVDAMGGDLAPDEIVKGAVHAQQELGAEIVLMASAPPSRPACAMSRPNSRSSTRAKSSPWTTTQHGYPPQEGRFHDGRAQHAA